MGKRDLKIHSTKTNQPDALVAPEMAVEARTGHVAAEGSVGGKEGSLDKQMGHPETGEPASRMQSWPH